ncbi:hypothetical protein HXZ94_09340 [Empedobacter falsenii]|uniref:hypothetical protein n=1 Tax=Empedobacter falsenii TaxID=343874 RepID=UPI002577F72E|nr:hypothetical protein [Empedobacter falsenii]MDM1298706.1 hypothetical protein [Empedobacter falsenii]MDM1318499.1 hypothetical protein [Empedobacter falsenii]
MKYLYTFIVCLFSTILFGQLTLGKPSITSESVIFDFDDSANNIKGIILPSVDALPTATNSENNGMFLFDETDLIVKVLENGIWKNLSDQGSSNNLYTTDRIKNTSSEIGEGIVIGDVSTTKADAILALESENKALRLPQIANPHLNVKSPYPGMMCFDTASDTLAVFDGENWNYWK